MEKKLSLVLMFVFLVIINTNAQIWDWAKAEPNGLDATGGTENDYTHDILTDNSGNVYTLGHCEDSLFLNGVYKAKNTTGSFIAKYNSSGGLLWYKLIKPAINGMGAITATDFCINSSGIYLTGVFNSNGPVNSFKIGSFTFSNAADSTLNGLFLCKMDFAGNVTWNKISNKEGGVSDSFITTDPNNNIIISGIVFTVTNDFEIGGTLIPLISGIDVTNQFVAKFDMNGNFQWSNNISHLTQGGAFQCRYRSIISDNNGNLFVYGHVPDTAYFGGIQFIPSAPSAEGLIFYLAKISSSGTWQFVKELCNNMEWPEITTIHYNFLACDNANNIYALVNPKDYIQDTTYLFGSLNIDNIFIEGKPNNYLLKYDNSGNLLWYKNYGKEGGSDQGGNSIFYTNNKLYIAGGIRGIATVEPPQYYSFSDLTVPVLKTAPDFGALCHFVARCDTSGKFKWVQLVAAESNCQAFAVCANGTNVYYGGYYRIAINSLGNLNGSFVNTENIFTFQNFFGKLKDQYIDIGTISPTKVCPGGTVSIPFTNYGIVFSPGNLFTAEMSDVTGSFDTPTQVGTLAGTGSGTISATFPTGLPYGESYRIRIVTSDTLKTGFNYYAYADTAYKITTKCAKPTAGFSTSNITSSTATVNWSTVSCATGYKIQYRKQGITTWTSKFVNGNTGNKSLTGLLASTAYQWRVATNCINSSPVVYSAYSSIQNFTTNTMRSGKEEFPNNISDVEINPNPASNTFSLRFETDAIFSQVQIFNITGQKIFSAKLNSEDGNYNEQIDISNLSNGVYFLGIQTGSGVGWKKFVKE